MKIRITAIRKASYPNLMAKYENPIEHACDVQEGQEWMISGLKCSSLRPVREAKVLANCWSNTELIHIQ